MSAIEITRDGATVRLEQTENPHASFGEPATGWSIAHLLFAVADVTDYIGAASDVQDTLRALAARHGGKLL